MPRKLKIPPRFFALRKDGSAYLVVAWDDDFFDVAYYRQYQLGEDGVEDEATANSIHKRFAIRRSKLIDALRVVFAEDLKSDWDADMVEYMIRSDPRVPKYPGRAHKEYDADKETDKEEPKWVPLTMDAADDRSLLK